MTAGKNRGIQHWQTDALFGALLLMMAALYVSRAALSVSLILFVCLALLHKKFFRQLKACTATTFLLSLSLLFFIPFLSGLWSEDLQRWTDVVRIKLPLLFLPLAFAGAWQFSKRQWLALTATFLAIVFGGCIWGLADYAFHAAEVHQNYLRAKMIRTPLEDDHVRFSWLVTGCFILCLLLAEKARQKTAKGFLLFLCLFFVIYLHILAARTGILSLYLFLVIYGGHALIRIKNHSRSFLLLCCLIMLPLLAYIALPTFRARLRYNVYDFSFAKRSQYLPGSSDGARTMSLKAGWQVLKQNPFGVGAGDVMHEADKWYAVAVPQVLATDKFYPSSEWLMYGAFAGWPGVLLFTAIMCLPFFVSAIAHKIYWCGFHATAAFSFVFDMGLEVQYGVFLYALLACGFWKAFDVRRER